MYRKVGTNIVQLQSLDAAEDLNGEIHPIVQTHFYTKKHRKHLFFVGYFSYFQIVLISYRVTPN